ncbi:nucleotide-binding universal stress UspA family protein [Diaminobutyricimonas aerilata]|uniref:Nucleotide-binding universal stress UspA family protein n=1 Tax=Diaminobutyricimonas aerilata TaxID=1162967 RepID=A0A2M9CGI2_9MICO|nr:universal stress protein [Diaminobutyricimonas aerilata]PJJ70962.1 nucleotide-binding universal stress UspA family protein [Diaminobutyricimonas aerilata]
MSRITVAYDGGPASRAALAWAVDRARAEAASIELLTAAEVALSGDTDWTVLNLEASEQASREGMEAARRMFSAAGITARVELGDATRRLVEASRDADLLVIGSKRGDREHPAHFERVPRKVATLAACPVVVVPARWTPAPGPILVGVGDEEVSTAPLDFAARSARIDGRPVHVVHAWWIVPRVAPAEALAVPPPEEDRARAEHRRVVETAVGYLQERADVAVTGEAIEGGTVRVMVEQARRAALTVVGSRRSGLFAEWLLGSLTHDLLLHLPCPVAVVPTTVRPSARRSAPRVDRPGGDPDPLPT